MNIKFKYNKAVLFLFISLFFLTGRSYAASNQFGETGLLSTPTVDTLGSGNICVGLWNNYSDDGGAASIMPFSLTFGLAKGMEVHASYPNLLFNDDTSKSGRGLANLGIKSRIWGANNSPFRLAVSGSGLKSISTREDRDGKNDYEAKLLAGLRKKKMRLHFFAGYRFVNSSDGAGSGGDQTFAGGAVDYSFHKKLKAFMETKWSNNGGPDADVTLTPGVQLFITPYVTISGGIDMKISGQGPDWRAVTGVSVCGGLGEYITHVPKPPKPAIEDAERFKGRPPVPILPDMVIAKRKRIEAEGGVAFPSLVAAPREGTDKELLLSKFEVPVESGEEVLITPAGISPDKTPATGLSIEPAGIEAPYIQPYKGKVIRKFRNGVMARLPQPVTLLGICGPLKVTAA